MKLDKLPAWALFFFPIVVFTFGTCQADPVPAGGKQVLSILGSSVAKGWKAPGVYLHEFTNGSALLSYGAHLTELEAADGWRVENQSIPGDTTTKVLRRFARDEIPAKADEDLIALSLGNEGLPNAADPQRIYNHFFNGITNLIGLSRANGIRPLLTDGYPRDSYTPEEYGYLKKMDLQLNTLDVPSVNFLGATDDGHGHWVKNDFINLGAGDGIHPNSEGHYEMFLAIVPSVFDALKAGKPTPHWGDKTRCLRITGDPEQPSPLTFQPDSIMHSFALVFRVRTMATGTVASIVLPGQSTHPTVEITPTGLAYLGADGVENNTGITCTNGLWHEIVVTHQYARGRTWVYVDGALAATVSERLTPTGFILGGPGAAARRPGSPATADYQDWLVYRSMLNAEEVSAEFQGHLQQASLELYAPLDDGSFAQGKAVNNQAQSLASAFVTGSSAGFQATDAGNAASGKRE